MPSIDPPDRRTAALLLFGTVLLGGSLWAFPQVPGVEYHTRVDPVDTADAERAIQQGYSAFEFEALSPEARTQFSAAKNNADGTATFDEPDAKPPEFQYGTDTATVSYVRDNGEYYLVATSRTNCFAALCDAAKAAVAFAGLAGVGCIGAALWRRTQQP